eukprot:TRINITY_DN338_c0_g1_i7.p1 TRINITY_DN338_c0_g1~~TRINITY_DN338_c0_g1_i7.p1  ORF type:complete len:338 (+),score=146.90 TRINITY_DN338_c0_g1_i7:109-1014(+)
MRAGRAVGRLLAGSAVRGAARGAAVPAVAETRPGATLWATIDGADRSRFLAVARTAPAGAGDLIQLREKITAQDPAMAKQKDIKKYFWKQNFETVTELMTFYENMMQPLHQIKADSYLKWTNRCDYWSKIAQTKNAAQSDLDDWKANHQRLGEEIDALAKEKAAYIARVFDTDIYNHVLGVLRLAAEESDAAHAAAVQVFHDMTENGIAFDDTTKILLRNVCFGDSYYDNSDLLMSHIEYPERGEHTLGKDEDLHQVSAIVLDVIGKRHKIDVHGPGVVLRNEEKLLSPSLDSPGKKEIEA